jgi:hypothetical protein
MCGNDTLRRIKSLGEALTDVNVGNIAIAAGSGALTGGASAFMPKGVTTEVVKVTIGAVESAAKQYNETGSVSLKKTVTDVAANVAGDKLTKNVNVNSSATVKTTEKQLDRATRVAAGDAASTGRAETVKKLENKVSAQKATNAAGQQATGGATANTMQAVADNMPGSASKVVPVATSASTQSKPAVDNATTKKTVIWPGPH